MNEEKRIQILHDIKRIALLLAKFKDYVDKSERAFDQLYKDLESEMLNDGNSTTDNK